MNNNFRNCKRVWSQCDQDGGGGEAQQGGGDHLDRPPWEGLWCYKGLGRTLWRTLEVVKEHLKMLIWWGWTLQWCQGDAYRPLYWRRCRKNRRKRWILDHHVTFALLLSLVLAKYAAWGKVLRSRAGEEFYNILFIFFNFPFFTNVIFPSFVSVFLVACWHWVEGGLEVLKKDEFADKFIVNITWIAKCCVETFI